MIHAILQWLSQHQIVLTWLGLLSFLFFVFSLLLLPWLIKKIPTDYFIRPRRSSGLRTLFAPLSILRNLVGFIILLAGIAMLVLPGQGILTVLVGLAIMKFPGKYQLERWLISRKGVLRAVNWLRRKTKTAEIEIL